MSDVERLTRSKLWRRLRLSKICRHFCSRGISNIDDGKLRYDMFVKRYDKARVHGGVSIREISTKVNYIRGAYKD